jgi:biotin carboxyl carrier protein
MKDAYIATTGQKTVTVKIMSDGEVSIDGQRMIFSFAAGMKGTYSLILSGKSYEVTTPERGASTAVPEGAISLSVNGKAQSVIVDDEQTHRLKAIFNKSAGRTSESIIKAPMPGLIARVEVVPGDEVVPGKGLLVLEAMKMENEIRSGVSGKVLKIHVEKGRAVEKGEPLVTIG